MRQAIIVVDARTSGDLRVRWEIVAVNREVAHGRVNARVPDTDTLRATVECAGVTVVHIDWWVRDSSSSQIADVVRALLVIE